MSYTSSQRGLRDPGLLDSPPYHNWGDPNHYLNCVECWEFRLERTDQAQEQANQTARLVAVSLGSPAYETRNIRVCPIRSPNGILVHRGKLTIRVQPGPRVPLHPPTPPTHKRSFSSTEESEPALHYPLPRVKAGTKNRSTSSSHPASASAMAGAWPSPAKVDSRPTQIEFQGGESSPQPSGLFRLLSSVGGWSLSLLHAIQNTIWRPVAVDVASEEQPTQPQDDVENKYEEISGSPELKRVRLRNDIDDLECEFETPEHVEPDQHLPVELRNIPNFNYEGHFSADFSDSEDEESDTEETPMDIDPYVSIESSTSEQDETDDAQSGAQSGEQSKPMIEAARRAVGLYPKGSKPSVVRRSLIRDPLKKVARDGIEKKVTPPKVAFKSDKLERLEGLLEVVPSDDGALPGLTGDGLSSDLLKAERLKRELMERVRREEEEAQNAILQAAGLRKAKSALIPDASPQWVNKAVHSAKNGKFDPAGVHPDAVELHPRDFAKLVPPTAWLNDDCVHSSLCCLAAYINKKAGIKSKAQTPKCVVLSSLYWMAFCSDYTKLYPRSFARKWGMNPENFLKIDTVLIPVNWGAHWTLIVLRPSRRTISYLDSFQNYNEGQVGHAQKWLELFLGDKYVPSEWNVSPISCPRQTNSHDCGVFVVTNGMCVALGISPMCYSEANMPMQRLRLAAMLLNGGFHGDFDLGHL